MNKYYKMEFKNIFKRNSKEKEIKQEFNPISLLFNDVNSGVGNGMTLSAVYRAVDFISSQFAMLDCQITKRNTKGHSMPAYEHNSYNLLSKEPNPYMTRHQLFKNVIVSMLLKGNAYIYINRDQRGEATSLYFIESSKVTITIVNDLPVYSIENKGVIDASNLIHIKNFSYDGFIGVPTVSFALSSLNIAKSADNHAKNFFTSGCSVGGVLTSEMKVNQVQKEELLAAWRGAFSTGKNGVAVLGGGWKYEPIEVDASTAQLLETRKFSVIEVARWFNISPILLYDLDKNSYNTAEASTLEFLQNTLMPIIDKIQLEIYKKLFKPSEKKLYDIKFDVESFLKGDLKTMAQYYTQLFQIGAITTNEIRKKLNMTEVEYGDNSFIQSNLVPIDYFMKNEVELDNKLKK